MDAVNANPNLIGLGIENRMASMTSSEVDLERKAAQVQKSGEEFEGVFLSLMLKEMRNTLDGGFFGEESSDTYGGMFDMFVGQDLAKSQPLGISKILLESYSKNAPAADAASGDAVSGDAAAPESEDKVGAEGIEV
jgi:Rod binding domain-containing protein